MNKGMGAGGKNTTKFGSAFEEKTSIIPTLLQHGFTKNLIDIKIKNRFCYSTTESNKNITFVKQMDFKHYLLKMHRLHTHRLPDEAFIIDNLDGTFTIKIIEKKNQNVSGSVEEKLKTGKFNKREYEKICGTNYHIEYAFCVSRFLQEKFESTQLKYRIMKDIMAEDKVQLFYGDSDTYFDNVMEWIL